MLKRILVLLVFLFGVLHAGNEVKLWTKLFGTTKDDTSGGVASDSSGNIYMAGTTQGSFDGFQNSGINSSFYAQDVVLIKLDSNGTKKWLIQYGNGSGCYAHRVTIDGLGNIYVIGTVNGALPGNTKSGNSDAMILKFDTNGNNIWARQWGGGSVSSSGLHGIAIDSSNNIYVTGYTDGALDGTTSKGYTDTFIAKLDTNGNKLWAKQYGSSFTDYPYGISIDSNGNIYVTGNTGGNFEGNTKIGGSDGFLLKVDSNGDTIWSKQFGVSASANRYVYGSSISVDNSGNIFLSGYANGSLNGCAYNGVAFDNGGMLAYPAYAFFAKLDSVGNFLWTKEFGAGNSTSGDSIKVDSSGNIYLAGTSYGSLDGYALFGGNDIFLAKYNQDGEKQWLQQWGSSWWDSVANISIETNGDIFISGYAYGSVDGIANSGATDIYVSKFVPTPSLSSLSNITITESNKNPTQNFTISDKQVSSASLVVTATSSDTSVIPNASITLGGSGGNRNVSILPNNKNGHSTITVTVSNGIVTSTASFDVNVSVNTTTAKTLLDDESFTAQIASMNTNAGSTIKTGSTLPSGLSLSDSSSATTLSGIIAQAGIYNFTISKNDGDITTSHDYNLTVKPRYKNMTINNSDTIEQNTTISLTAYDETVEQNVPFTEYTATVLNNNDLIDFANERLIAKVPGNFTTTVDVLFSYKDMNIVKTFTVTSTSLVSGQVTKTSYESSPFNIVVGQGYTDTLSSTNSGDKTRWYKFSIDDSTTLATSYSLIYKPAAGSVDNPNPYPSGTNITYSLYSLPKGQTTGSKTVIGSKSFSADSNFTLPLVLSKDKDYYLAFATASNLIKDVYTLDLLENGDEASGTVYFKKLTLDNNGTATYRVVLPQSNTYDFTYTSVKSFTATFDGNTTSVTAPTATVTSRKKAGVYTLNFSGNAGQDVYFNIDYSAKELELEPNDTYMTANIYNKTTTSSITNSDTDYFAFVADSSSATANMTLKNSTISGSEVVQVYLLNASGGEIGVESDFGFNSKKSLVFDFSGYGISSGSYYILKVVRTNTNSGTLNYDLIINGSKRVLSAAEESYTALYNSYKANATVTLDTNLNIVDTATSISSVADSGELIILTGDSDNPTDALYTASQKLSALAYSRFVYRGLSDDDIYWINGNNQVDVDNDGKIDSTKVDSTTLTIDNFYNAIANAAKSGKSGPLYIYMVDHGAANSFKVSTKSGSQIIYASELKKRIDQFNADTKNKRDVVVIMEACKSGSFADELTANGTNNNVAFIASSQPNELSYIDNTGSVSFTKIFIDKMLAGNTLYKSYTDAKTSLSTLGGVYKNQAPMFVASADTLKNLTLGGNFAAAGMSLTTIDTVKVAGNDSNATAINVTSKNISLEATITSRSAISKVWATVITPDYTPPAIGGDYVTPDLTNYTKNLVYDTKSQTYKATYTISTDKSYSGSYTITINAEDKDGLVYSKTVVYGATGDLPAPVVQTNNTAAVYTLNLKAGWNLVTTPVDYNIPSSELDSIFGTDSLVWTYDPSLTNKWSVHIGSSLSVTTPSNVGTISNISSGYGYWVKVTSDKTGVDFSDKSSALYSLKDISALVNANKGWNLLGTAASVTTDEIYTAKPFTILWKYSSSGWKAMSKDTNVQTAINNAISSNKISSTFSSVEAGEGLWVLVK